MGVEVRPLNVQCNIQCLYCYQTPQRDAGNISKEYSIEKIKEAVEKEGGPFILFGGEPLLLPLEDLEELWSWGLARFGRNGIQTNGSLIGDAHIQLFRRYNVKVGISIDGPDELNDVRWKGTTEQTRITTDRSQKAIERLCLEGTPPALIITLHRGNAVDAKLPKLVEWVRRLSLIGVKFFRLHLLESEDDTVRQALGLSIDENLAALRALMELSQQEPGIHIDLFREMENLLLGHDENTSCIWNACDPYTTLAVQGIEGNGQRSNCGRTNKYGIDFVKANQVGFERYLALYHTPQPLGGCSDCRFFLMCKGQCPGTALDGDWRNRSEHCEVWRQLFTIIEGRIQAQGRISLSMRSDRKEIEEEAIAHWAQGRPVRLVQLLKTHDRRVAENEYLADRQKHITAPCVQS